MRPGKLRHRVTLQSQDVAPRNAMGEIPLTWTDLGSRACEIKTMSGREYLETFGQDSELSVRIWMRGDSLTKTLKPENRLLDERSSPAVVYNIKSILSENRERDLIFVCTRDG